MNILRLFLFVLALQVASMGQSPGYLTGNNDTGIPEYGSFISTDIDTINLQNGGVNIQIPFLNRSMRGFSYKVGFRYDSKFWVQDSFIDQYDPAGPKMMYFWRPDYTSGWQPFDTQSVRVDWSEQYDTCDAVYSEPYYWANTLIHPDGEFLIRHSYQIIYGDGTKYQVPARRIYRRATSQGGDGEACAQYYGFHSYINNATAHSANGHVKLDLTNDSPGTPYGSGAYNLTATFPNGTVLSQLSTSGVLLTDTNGNTCCATDSEGWLLDNLGRRNYRWRSGSGAVRYFDYIDSNSVTQTITVEGNIGPGGPISSPPTCTSFPTTFRNYQGPCLSAGVTRITLANGQHYDFLYEDNTSEAGVYNELTRINLPSGGYIKYKYASFAARDYRVPQECQCDQATAMDARMLVEKRVSDGVGPERVWTYSYTSTTTSVTDPDGNVEVHTFDVAANEAAKPKEVSVEYFQGASTSLKKVETEWLADNGPVSLGVPSDATGTMWGGVTMDVRNQKSTRTTTILKDISPNISSKTETDFADCFTYSSSAFAPYSTGPYTDCRTNPTQTREYDYGFVLKRSTVNTYLHQTDSAYNDAHIWDNIVETQTYSGSAPTTTVSCTTTIPSNLAACTINTYSSSVSSTTGVPYHVSVSGPRGNLASVAHWKNNTGTWPTTTNAYNDVGNVTSTTDPGGHVTQYDYTDNFTDGVNRNSQGFLTKVTLAQTGAIQHIERKQYFWNTGLTAAECGQNYPAATACAWNSNAAPTNPDHFVFSYDLLNRPVTVKNTGGGSRTFTYYTNSARMDKAVAAGTYSQTVLWDGLGRVTQSQLNSAVPYPIYQDTEYDAGGKVWKSSSPYYSNDTSKRYITRTEYDGLGRVKKVTTEADGNYSTVSYVGNVTISTDQTGRLRQTRNDGLGRMDAVWEPHETSGSLLYWTTYSYDALNSLLQVYQNGTGTNPRIRTFTYNSLSQLLTATNPETGTITYTYDAEGNVATKTAPKPNQTGSLTVTTTYAYDALHRLTDKTFSDGTQNSSNVYDLASFWGISPEHPIGRRIAATAAMGSIGSLVSYDPMGRPKKTWECTPGGGGCKVFEYAYNLDSTPSSLTYSQGRLVTFGYDTASRLNDVKYQQYGGSYPNYHYWQIPTTVSSDPGFHPSGSVFYTDLGNGVREKVPLDNRLRTDSINVSQTGTSNVWINRTYVYEANSNISRVADALVAGRSQNFTYDKLNRIFTANTDATSGADTWSQTYTIDAWGNLKQFGTTPFVIPADAKNQLSDSNNPLRYVYDAAGNMTSFWDEVAIRNYAYDGENRITTAGGFTYTYDADGKRIKKTNGTNATYYYYGAGSDVLTEITDPGTQTDYIFAGGKRIAKAPSEAITSNTEYYHGDHLGSARLMTNASGGVVPNSYGTFLPFGQELVPTTNNNHYKFTGKERDPESGMDYFGARYYGSGMGRWLTADWSDDPEPVPYADLTDPQTLNLYGYVGNRPITATDADGHCAAPLPCPHVMYMNPIGFLVAINIFIAEETAKRITNAYVANKEDEMRLYAQESLTHAENAKKEKKQKEKEDDDDDDDTFPGEKKNGHSDRQQRLKQLKEDPKQSSVDRGWLKQDENQVDRGKRTSLRTPPGKQLAHARGREAAKGYSHRASPSSLQNVQNHRTQHRYDNNGKKNKERKTTP